MDEVARSVRQANLQQTDFRYVSSGLYDCVERPGQTGAFQFRLAEKFSENILDVPPDALTMSREEFAGQGRAGDPVSHYWIAIPSIDQPSSIVTLAIRDLKHRATLEEKRMAFWGSVAIAFLIFFAALSAAMFAIVRRPIGRLREALLSEKGEIEVLAPDEFGEFGYLVEAIQTHVRRTRSFVATAENVDPITGLLSGQAALAAYLEAHQNADEVCVVFFRANSAKEYVKTFGRLFRDRILKITGSVVATGLPVGAKLFAVQDHFLMTFLTESAFQQCYSVIQKYFSRAIQPLFEKGEASKVPLLTLSAVGLSNKSAGFETFHETLQKLHEDWDKLVNKQNSGWAMMNSDDQWVKGIPEEIEGGETEVIPEEPEALKDPVFARKVFIVKLAFMFKFDPQKASKLYKMGYTRLPALLDDGILEKVKKFGPDAAADIKGLIDRIRMVPKSRLYYNESDFKQVFVTDIRMIRKIPREILSRWFSAGFRSLEDLAYVGTDDLLKIDGTAARADVQAVIDQAKLAAPPAGAG